MRGLQQTLAAYNIYDDMTEVVVLLTQRRTLDKIREKIPPMGKGCDSLLSPAVEEIENVHANLSLYIALKKLV